MQFVFMFDHFKMGEQKQMCIWLNLNLNLEFEFANPLQYTQLNGIFNKPVLYTSWTTLSCACAFYFDVAPLC